MLFRDLARRLTRAEATAPDHVAPLVTWTLPFPPDEILAMPAEDRLALFRAELALVEAVPADDLTEEQTGTLGRAIAIAIGRGRHDVAARYAAALDPGGLDDYDDVRVPAELLDEWLGEPEARVFLTAREMSEIAELHAAGVTMRDAIERECFSAQKLYLQAFGGPAWQLPDPA